MDAPEIDGVVKLNKNVSSGKIVPVKITGSGFYDLSGQTCLPAGRLVT